MALAGLAWGFTFVAPVLAPAAPVLLLAAGRFVVFGLAAVPQAARILAADPPWGRAVLHALTGSVLYYALLVAGIRLAGPTPAVAVIGLIPAVLAVLSARRARTGIGPLIPALTLLAAGQILIQLGDAPDTPSGAGQAHLAAGTALAGVAVASWCWYGLDSHRLLRERPDLVPLWAGAQGLAAAALSLPALVVVLVLTGVPDEPLRVAAVVVALGVLSSWLAVRLWNAAAPALPETLTSQLLSLETASGFVLAAAVAATWPSPLALAGEAAILLGCVLAVATANRSTSSAGDPRLPVPDA